MLNWRKKFPAFWLCLVQLVIRTGHCLWMDDHRVKKMGRRVSKMGSRTKNWLVPSSGNLGWSQNETRPEHPVSSVLCQFCGHLGWVKSLKWCQGKGVSTQWGRGRFSEWGWGRGSSPWGCRITCAKWHHEWLFELTRRHSWCHLAQVILHPQTRAPPSTPIQWSAPPHWVSNPLPWHHFRDLNHPRCPQNWHKTNSTRVSCRVSFCDHPKFPDLVTKYQFEG